MKFSCEKALLQSAVSIASRAVSTKSSIPALEGILVEAAGSLRLTGYNLETGIRTSVEAEVREEGGIVLNARLFGEIVKKLPDETVVLSTDKDAVRIECGRSLYRIVGSSADDFPELPEVGRGQRFYRRAGKACLHDFRHPLCRERQREPAHPYRLAL
jgi:DNA polymerase-3 subunit beta